MTTGYDDASTTYDLSSLQYDGGAPTPPVVGVSTYELAEALAVKAGLPVGTSAVTSANALASTTNMSVVGALNVLAGNTKPQYKELAGVLNQLAGTVGFEAQGAASRWAGR